ncbi:MAG TPA: DNA-formamidopyrimidine glycosylase family protein [Acidimicrobiales bacterium]|nr:DNA-formamidopyrimidine glycosylase family protein [Acidimicrobiales bacterium]
MPELPEVEAYRRLADERALGRTIVAVGAPDAWYLKGGLDADALAIALVGHRFEAARRIGKLLLLDVDGDGPVLGLRFGMTGRLLVDDNDVVGELLYTSKADRPEWDRFLVRFDDGGVLRMQDPRRLGGVLLDPPEGRLGADATTVTPAVLRAALGASTAPLKARLLNQAHLAGVGNLIADEALWRAGLDPRRPARSLTDAEHRRLHKHLRASVVDLMARGGSHTGDLRTHRAPGGRCPKDGTALQRDTVGGRTTWWCPKHQR